MNDIVQYRPGSDLDGLVRIWPKPTRVRSGWPGQDLAKTDPGPIWMAWSGFGQNRPGSDLDGLVRIWPKPTRVRSGWPGQDLAKTSGLKASCCAGIIGSGFWQDATGPLPLSQFQARFRSSTDVPDKYCAKPGRVRFSSD